MADSMQIYKYCIHNVAKSYGKTATFMPKPLFGDNGTGMHIHQSLWKKGKPVMAGNEYAGLSQMAVHYIGGILKTCQGPCATCNPTTNSYKRLVPGYGGPREPGGASARNRKRGHSHSDLQVRVRKPSGFKYRPPDPAANPDPAYTALLMAGLDGVLNKIDPGRALGQEHLRTAAEGVKKIPTVCGSLREALSNLRFDYPTGLTTALGIVAIAAIALVI